MSTTGGDRPESWVSVDVETAGPNPGSYAMLSIGACLLDDPEVGVEILLKPVTDTFVGDAMAVSSLDFADLAERGLAPAAAMEAFEAWLLSVIPAGHRPIFVGFNAPFDWMFVADYFGRYLGRNPFGHSAIDIKAFAMGVAGVPWSQTSVPDLTARYDRPKSLTHNALQDARDQAAIMVALLAEQRSRPQD
jgi:ribonuclease T